MTPGRHHCPTCLRPGSTCICRWITPTPQEVEVLVLQHPQELNQAKGSARLLHLSLPGSQLQLGEVFEPQVLQSWLAGPRYTVLLYPDTPHNTAPDLRPPPALDPQRIADPTRVRLLVLDGTWRKSRKMLYLNPALQALPRLALQHPPASRYHIRKAHQAHQLSTLEATCAALAQLEHQPRRYAPLLAAFDRFVAQQLAFHRQGAAL